MTECVRGDQVVGPFLCDGSELVGPNQRWNTDTGADGIEHRLQHRPLIERRTIARWRLSGSETSHAKIIKTRTAFIVAAVTNQIVDVRRKGCVLALAIRLG
jgi:hypothetical protein